jgi:hypothetical protein
MEIDLLCLYQEEALKIVPARAADRWVMMGPATNRPGLFPCCASRRIVPDSGFLYNKINKYTLGPKQKGIRSFVR